VPGFEADELYAAETLERLAKAIAPEDVQLFYQTAITGRRDLALAPDPRAGFEMTLLRMVAFRPVDEAGARAPALPSANGTTVRGAAAARAAAAAGTSAKPGSMAKSASPVRASASVVSPGDAPPAAPESSAIESWSTLMGALDLQGAARQLASNCLLLSHEGAVVRLALDPRNKHMRTAATEDKLTQALTRHFGGPVRLEFELAAGSGETPAQADQRASQSDLAAARRALEADPGVEGFRERFGATLLPDTVRPLK
jgi:DNA polymerase-3 subunit gamma/tau